MEDVLDSERDAGLGNGGLGRLAACYSGCRLSSQRLTAQTDCSRLAVDSLSSMDIPAWGYGLRYQYGSK